MKTEEINRKGKDAGWKLSHPRELCVHCWEWIENDGTPQNDISGCSAIIKTDLNYYLLDKTNECPYFIED